MEKYFKPINGFEGVYSISNMGDIFSHHRLIKRKNGSPLWIKPRYIKHSINKGYLRAGLRLPNGKTKTIEIHRAIAEHFIDNPERLPQVNHINGIKTDNSINNLEWCTASHNIQHAYDTRLMVREGLFGVRNPSFKGKIIAVNIENGETFILSGSTEIALNGFLPSKVYCCIRGERKTHKNHSFALINDKVQQQMQSPDAPF